MKRFIGLMVLAIVVMSVPVLAADYDTTSWGQTMTKPPSPYAWEEYKWSMTTDGSGDYNGSTSGVTRTMTGYIIQVQFVKSGCSSGMDVFLYDENGVDVLMASGVSLNGDANTDNYATPLNGDGAYIALFNEKVYPVVDDSGATKTVVLKVLVVPGN